jgi:ceramide glucosyltransferase
MDDNTGLVTATIRGVAADSFGSILENLHLNTYIASSVFAVSHLFRMPVSIGKSMLLRRSFIEKIGGFRKFADYLAEDHLLSEEVLKHGMQVAHSTHMIDNVNNSLSIGQFCSRHLRWARMRRNLSIGNFAAEMISNPVFNALVYLAIAQDTPATILFLIALEAKLTLDALMLKAMDSDLPVSTLLLSPVRDIIIGIIWFVPFMGNKINWRGNRFRIHRGTLLSRA